jgi:hypothetical protein
MPAIKVPFFQKVSCIFLFTQQLNKSIPTLEFNWSMGVTKWTI